MVKRLGCGDIISLLPRCFQLGFPATAAGTTLLHSSILIRAGVRKTKKTTKKRRRDTHVQRTAAAARRPDDDSHRGQDRRCTDRNDLSEKEWRQGGEPGWQYAAVRHWLGRRAGPRTARTDCRIRRGTRQVPQQPRPDQTAARRCCNRGGRSGEGEDRQEARDC